MKDLLKGFGGNFGGAESGPDPSTLVGLIELVRAWSQGADASARLIRQILDLAERSRQAALETKQDLKEELDPALAEVLNGLFDCFVEAEEELTRLAKRVRKKQDVAESLEVLELLQADMGQLSRCLAGWTSSPEPLCAHCGSKGPEETCPRCLLERLIPDPSPDPEVRSAHLGPQYLALYQTYRDIVNGEAPLRDLESRLHPLQKDLQQLQWLSRNSPFSLQQEAEEGLGGLLRMRTALTSRRACDLNEGWAQVFRGAAALAEKLPALLRQAGQAEEASAVEHSRRLREDTRLCD